MISKLERLLSGGTVTWDRLLVTDGLSPEAVEQITAVSPRRAGPGLGGH